MKLEDCLAFIAGEFLDDRAELLDGDDDSLWSDKTLTRYLNDAQTRLCRRAWQLVDIAHPKAGVITLVEAKTVYTLHPSVLRVMDIVFDTATVPLPHVADADVLGVSPPSTDFFDINTITARTPGNPLAFSTDAGTRLMRVTPAPAADQAGLKVYLRVARLPTCPLDSTKKSESPEIDEQWHLDMCRYAAGCALQHPTADSNHKTLGKNMVEAFEVIVREARQERERLWSSPARAEFCSMTARLA